MAPSVMIYEIVLYKSGINLYRPNGSNIPLKSLPEQCRVYGEYNTRMQKRMYCVTNTDAADHARIFTSKAAATAARQRDEALYEIYSAEYVCQTMPELLCNSDDDM
jgi:hypothetical protein